MVKDNFYVGIDMSLTGSDETVTVLIECVRAQGSFRAHKVMHPVPPQVHEVAVWKAFSLLLRFNKKFGTFTFPLSEFERIDGPSEFLEPIYSQEL